MSSAASSSDPIAVINEAIAAADCALSHPRPLPAGHHAHRSHLAAAPELQELYHALYHVYANEGSAVAFKEPVDALALGVWDYYTVVKEPASLRGVLDAIADGRYADAAAAERDLDRVWANCRAYNGPTSRLAQEAARCAEAISQQRAAYRDAQPATVEQQDEAAAAIEACAGRGDAKALEAVHQYLQRQENNLLDAEGVVIENLTARQAREVLQVIAAHSA